MQLILDFSPEGEILDLGGGGEGVIGRALPSQTTAIDRLQSELDEAPGEFRKLVMDATALEFPDASFDHVTSFFTMMYMSRDDQAKAIVEAARVLRPGGGLHLWDAEIESAEPEPFCVDLEIVLPNETIRTTYGVIKPDARQDARHFIALCESAGFHLTKESQLNGIFELHFCRRSLS